MAKAKEQLAQVGERERHRLRREQQALEGVEAKAIAALEERAETARRERAAQLLREAFDTNAPDSIASLIARWRVEPSRQITVALKTRWSELNATALAELGSELAPHVLATPLIDLIAAALPGSINRLATDQYGSGDKGIHALAQFIRAATPTAAEAALRALEDALLAAGRRSASEEVSAVAVARHALRREHATVADVTRASCAFDEEERARQAEAFRAEYVPPPPQPPLRRFTDWVTGRNADAQ